MFFCAISGEPPQDPVVSTKSGHVYERRLITKYIAENGTDPITGEKLEEADLITVKASPKASAPRPPAMTSVPALLHTLQNEWDALMLETFTLKQQYNATRQELSHALYQQDAATRVVARIAKERDAAREALASVNATLGGGTVENQADIEMSEAKEEPQGVLPSTMVEEIDVLFKTLSASRKKRKVAADYINPSVFATFAQQKAIPSLHKSSPAGINALTLSQSNPTRFLTGGNDKIVQLFDSATSKVVASLSGHTKKVTRVAFREASPTNSTTLILSASMDKTSRIWAQDSASGEYAPHHTIKVHKGEVTGLSLLPTRTLLALSSTDKTYSIHDLSTQQRVYHSPVTDAAFTSASVHPDGLLLALGTNNSAVQIYDVRSGAVAASLTPSEPSSFSVETLSFSENGYHLCAPISASSLSIWDLRHLKSAATIDLGTTFKVNAVKYDPGSGLFLGVAGNEGLRVFRHKTWEELVRLETDGLTLTDLDWNADATQLWATGGREVRVWGPNDPA